MASRIVETLEPHALGGRQRGRVDRGFDLRLGGMVRPKSKARPANMQIATDRKAEQDRDAAVLVTLESSWRWQSLVFSIVAFPWPVAWTWTKGSCNPDAGIDGPVSADRTAGVAGVRGLYRGYSRLNTADSVRKPPRNPAVCRANFDALAASVPGSATV